MTVEFKPAGDWSPRGGGRPPIPIPPELSEWLEKTYQTGTFCELPFGDQDETGAMKVVRLAQLACRRAERSLQYELDHEARVLRLKMRDKRPYTRNEAP